MEKFTPLTKILHCRRQWRHGQISPLRKKLPWMITPTLLYWVAGQSISLRNLNRKIGLIKYSITYIGYFRDQFQTLCSFISPLSCTSVAQLWCWFSLKFGFSFSFVRLITGLQNNLLGWQLLMKQPEQSCPQHSLSQFSNLDQQHNFLVKKRKTKPFCLSLGYLQTRAH